MALAATSLIYVGYCGTQFRCAINLASVRLKVLQHIAGSIYKINNNATAVRTTEKKLRFFAAVY